MRRIERVSVVGRDPDRASAFAASVAAAHEGVAVVRADVSAVRDAQVVVCATGAREPLFDGDLVPDRACVVAMGSHERTARELDETLLGRSLVVVEDPATALREAGDVVAAVAAATLEPGALTSLRDLVTDVGRCAGSDARPRVFKSVGMAWEDLVVAEAVRAMARRDGAALV